mmetsp:Transcript_55888/g.175272  ORF Transcript_55888/g.175272 Transcript_55888/m.175272 type:complete len:218 (-) Transcript_55888:3-656(-)
MIPSPWTSRAPGHRLRSQLSRRCTLSLPRPTTAPQPASSSAGLSRSRSPGSRRRGSVAGNPLGSSAGRHLRPKPPPRRGNSLRSHCHQSSGAHPSALCSSSCCAGSTRAAQCWWTGRRMRPACPGTRAPPGARDRPAGCPASGSRSRRIARSRSCQPARALRRGPWLARASGHLGRAGGRGSAARCPRWAPRPSPEVGGAAGLRLDGIRCAVDCDMP